MKATFYCFIIMLLSVGLSPAHAQTTIPGRAQNMPGPKGFIKDIYEMERSPMNVKHTGPAKPADGGELNREKRELEKAQLNNNKNLQQRSVARVFPFDESKNVTFPARPPLQTLSLTTQDPAFSFVGNVQDGWIPSDAQGAAGPAYIVVLSNGDARVINKLTGGVVSDVTLEAFFSDFGGAFDPRIFYDPFGQRFVALALSGASNCTSVDSKFRIMVSNTSDPTQGWYFYEFDFDADNAAWIDFALLGFNKDWIVMNGNSICGTARNSVFAFPKAAVYQGIGFTYYSWPGTGIFAPAFTYDNSLDRVYFVGAGNPNSGGTGYVDTKFISGNPPTLTASNSYGTAPWQAFANDNAGIPDQYGSSVKFDKVQTFGGSFYQSSVYRNGSLWFTHPIFLPATGTTTRSSTQWWQVDPATEAVQQVGRIDDPSGTVSTFYPSIAVNAANDAVVSYCIFSPDYYQSAGYNFRNASDPAGTVPRSSFYAAGGNINTSTRTGDYGETVVDPNDDMSVWAINQISSSSADFFETAVTLIPAYYGCPADFTFGNVPWLGNTKSEASNSILSQEIIQPNSNVVYDAGKLVVLSPGFRATGGSKFRAYINGCGGSTALGDNTERSALESVMSTQHDIVPLVNGLEAFPNPTASEVRIVYSLEKAEKSALLQVHNVAGNNVRQMSLNSRAVGRQNIVLNLADLPSGIYTIHIQLSSGKQFSTKVLVKK